MIKIGVHALTFIGDIENSSIENCLSKVAKIGYDVMELPLLNPDALDTGFVSKAYEKFNIEPTVSLGLSYKTDISSEDQDRVKAGKDLLLKALDKSIFVFFDDPPPSSRNSLTFVVFIISNEYFLSISCSVLVK